MKAVEAHTCNLRTLEGRNRIVISKLSWDRVTVPQKEKKKRKEIKFLCLPCLRLLLPRPE